MNATPFVATALAALLITSVAAADDDLPDLVAQAGRDLTGLHRVLNSGRSAMDPDPEIDGLIQFQLFHKGLIKALAGHDELLSEVDRSPGKWAADVRELLVGGYLTRAHGRRLREDLTELVQIRTITAPADAADGDPELQRLGQWLAAKAQAFGLAFRAVAPNAWEISLGKGRRTIAAVARIDAPAADAAAWRHPPYKGKVASREVWGRGAGSGKAALVTLLYSMKSIRDAAVPLRKRLVLVVAAGSTAGPSGLLAYKRRAKLPKTTFVAGGAFPLVVGEKGIATLSIASIPGTEPDAGLPGWKVISLASESRTDRVPSEARAILDPRELSGRRALGAARRNLTLMRKAHPEIDATVEEEGVYIAIRFRGRTAPSATPDQGRNAAADLVVFLSDFLGVFPDHRGRLVRFLAAHIGHELDGAKLGVRGSHPIMGSTTVNLARLTDTGSGPPTGVAEIRWPTGRRTKELLAAVRAKARAFVNDAGGSITVTGTGTDPVYIDRESPFAAALSKAYQQVARRQHAPRTVSEPTWARHIPGAVGFGPSPAGANEDPERKDERIGLEEIENAARIYTTALLRLLTR
jgi:acetylornithine deacetylase/succinyl-diaminopimelate desuccinylase-like protein